MPPRLYKIRRWIAAIDWLGITRILVIQLIVLFVLSLAVIRYLNWTSELAQTEFMRAIRQTASGTTSHHRPSDRHWDHHGRI